MRMHLLGYSRNCSSENRIISVTASQKYETSATQWKVIVFQAMKIVHHHANGRFDRLISEHQSINPLREAISILSGKYKRFTFVRPVNLNKLKLTFVPRAMLSHLTCVRGGNRKGFVFCCVNCSLQVVIAGMESLTTLFHGETSCVPHVRGSTRISV